MYGYSKAESALKRWEAFVMGDGEVMVVPSANAFFSGLVARVNRRPLLWTIGSLILVYPVAMFISAVALLSDPMLNSPLLVYGMLFLSALGVVLFHWFLSRYQKSSMLGQWIQIVAATVPVFGGYLVLSFSRLVGVD
jgi:hypothetical protein